MGRVLISLVSANSRYTAGPPLIGLDVRHGETGVFKSKFEKFFWPGGPLPFEKAFGPRKLVENAHFRSKKRSDIIKYLKNAKIYQTPAPAPPNVLQSSSRKGGIFSSIVKQRNINMRIFLSLGQGLPVN